MEFKELKKATHQVELVDAHAHNIVSLDSSFPFIRTFSEATGDALSFAHHSLSFKRNLREVAQLYGTEVSLEAIEKHRQTLGLHSLTTKCFNEARISALLIDDGLKLDKKQDIEWHRNFVPCVGRVLRIETLAEQILDEESPDDSSWTLDSFTKAFDTLVPEIVALKTIAAYPSGLDIDTHVRKEVAETGLVEVLQGYKTDMAAGKPVRLGNKGLVDYILTRSLEVAERCDLPLQIHTGDLDLRLSNPLHLRNLLEDTRFEKCRIVLLHASYPFSKEASYLSSVYPQVYLDFGLAVPKLSVHGMVSSVKELLDLAPTKKKAREVIFLVLRDACVSGDLSLMEAIDAAKDILSRNAIAFYKLDVDTSSSIPQSRIAPYKSQMEEPHVQEDSSSFVRVIWVDTSGQQRCRVGVSHLTFSLVNHRNLTKVTFVVQIVHAQRFNRSVKKNGIGLTHVSMGMTSFYDGPAEESKLTGVGEIRLVPDLSTKRTIPWTKQESMVLADMLLKPGEAWEYCPRETLRRVSKVLKDEFDLVMNAGFENEFYVLKNVVRERKEEYVPFDVGPYCSTSSYDAASPMFHEIIPALESLNIPVEQFHAESGKGQFEVSLGHTDAFHAADNLVYTREVIRSVARKHGLLATFVPKYDLCDIGSGSHVHISLWKNGENVFPASDKSSAHGMSSIGEKFMAGVLFHLPSIFAVLAPLPNSYDRIQPNTFSGAFQCWGKENREAAIRTASPPGAPDGLVTNFEIKACDGSTNPHLSLAIIMAAGIDGLRRHLQLPDPTDTNPADVAATLKRLPETLSEAVEALEKDKVLHELLGQNLVVAITGVRKVHYCSLVPRTDLQWRVNASLSRRQAMDTTDQAGSSPCLTGNPIDDCWKCDPNWPNNRQGLADCGIGFGQYALGGKGGRFYFVTDSSDDDAIRSDTSGAIVDSIPKQYDDKIKARVTIAFNHFGEKLIQRMPRCRRGYIHVVNNDFTQWEMYAIGGSGNPTINSQGNRFTAPSNPFAKEVTKRVETPDGEWKGWNWRSEGDILVNGAFFVASGEGAEMRYEKAYSVEPKSASFIDQITFHSGVLGVGGRFDF
ncbi:hypothetical protein Bca4012_039560 [Brassica carinata]